MNYQHGNWQLNYAGGISHEWTSDDHYPVGCAPAYQCDEFSGFNRYENEDMFADRGFNTNGHHRSTLQPYSSLTRTSSADSMDYSFQQGNYEMRNPTQMQYPPSAYMNQQSKCRQLPCRTFISTGSCPYGDRCVFLHDPSIVSKPIYIRSKRKSRDDPGVDAFFWPTMPWSAVMGRVDSKNMPLITQPYIVPAPNSYSQSSSNNDVAVYSMWEHFLDFCKEDPLSVVTAARKVPILNPYALNNPHTGRKRLPVFVDLSQHSSDLRL